MHSIYNLKYHVPQTIPVVFHNESNYDYHYIKQLAEEFQFTCLGIITEKYITIAVLIEKVVTRVDKNGEKLQKILQFLDNTRFIASSSSNLVILWIIYLTDYTELNVN